MDLTSISRELKTERLYLRPLGMQDDAGMFAMLSDPESMRYWCKAPIKTISEAQQVLRKDVESDAKGNSMCWAILLKSSEQMIGKCILFQYSAANRRAEVGYILNRDYWRQGLMFEALNAMTGFAFKRLNIHRLEADVDPGNTGSLALLEKLGFKREGTFKDRWRVYDEWQDSVMLGLIEPL